MKKFDLIKTPLNGKNLIEASAGTGKTYAIAGLFVRLVVEEKIPPEKILVVTFTKAATEELKERIRKRLVESREAFLTGSTDDPFLKAILEKHNNPLQAAELIKNALLDFDRIAIFTIHGFCQRILHENAFETGSLFDTELIVDQSSIVQEIADDFWRKHFYKKPPEFLSFALKKVSGPEYYAALLNKTRSSEVRIVPEVSEPSLVSTIPFKNNFEKLKQMWPTAREKIVALLQDPALNAKVYGNLKASSVIDSVTKRSLTNREKNVNDLAWEMDKYVTESNIGLPVFKEFEKFTATKIQKSTKKKFNPPDDEFFDISDELFNSSKLIEKNVEEYLLYLKINFFRYAGTELLKRKKKSNIQFFDDLLTRVQNALEQDDGDGNFLLQAARAQYSAALLDEFQDTDPVQFKIFFKIFNSEQHKLFMIGDPKQSIYSFRGADIFSYIEAASDADYKYTLTENWRSAPQLITAVNTIFSGLKAPFVYEEIDFTKVKPGKIESTGLMLDAPLQLWYLSSKQLYNQDKPINKGDAISMIAEAVSCEIAKLILSKNINEGDIAVLVRKNSQARLVKEYLSRKNIPSVLYNSENIFDSHEAHEIEQVLKAIAEPGNEMLLKAALVTDMMGVTGDLLYSVENDSLWWEKKISGFNEYYNLWKKHGFIRMFGMFMSSDGIRERLLKLRDGDRRVTNILHLGEILQQKSLKKTITISGLIKWLAEQRDNPLRLDEDQIRLESDEQSVKIVTMHKSKGLEYKVVFCAYAWEGSETRDKEIFFHTANKNRSLVLDLGSDDFKSNLPLAENEILAENIRLLYVALTRAKSLCYLVWGRINTAETSALSYILHNRDLTSSENIIAAIKDTFKRKTDTDLIEDLTAIAEHSDGAIKFVSLPVISDIQPVIRQEEHQDLYYRSFSGNIDTSWKISSYSSLVSQKTFIRSYNSTSESKGTYSSVILPEQLISEKENIAFFPKGAHAGIFFHDIFEHLDFMPNDPEHMEALVKNKLNEYSFDPLWLDAVCAMVIRVLSIPLTNDNGVVSLSQVSSGERINEMEFYFPLNPVSVDILRSVFADFRVMDIACDFPEQLEKLTFMPAKGFMKGYIDMVFRAGGKYYLIDWKSNFLGEKITDYDQSSMMKVMEEDYYILQYHLYAVALHQYLALRIKEYNYSSDFGGIFYIFIKGVDPDCGSEYGVFFDIPGKEIMNRLGTAMIPQFLPCV